MTRLLSIDPGVRCCGWAVWRDRMLMRCGLSRASNDLSLSDCVKSHYFPELIIPLAYDLVIEKPQVYAQRFLKGDPGDLINLAIIVGSIVRMAAGKVTIIEPKEWKGQLPKDVSEKRTLKMLSDVERRIVEQPIVRGFPETAPPSLLHNMYDAIGIGLYHLKR